MESLLGNVWRRQPITNARLPERQPADDARVRRRRGGSSNVQLKGESHVYLYSLALSHVPFVSLNMLGHEAKKNQQWLKQKFVVCTKAKVKSNYLTIHQMLIFPASSGSFCITFIAQVSV